MSCSPSLSWRKWSLLVGYPFPATSRSKNQGAPWKFNSKSPWKWMVGSDEFPFGIPYFQGRTVKLPGCNFPKFLTCLLPNDKQHVWWFPTRLVSDTKHQYLSPPVLGGSWQCAHACLHSKAGWRVFLSGSDPQRDASLQNKVLRNIQTCKGLVHLVLLATEMARSKPLAIYIIGDP